VVAQGTEAGGHGGRRATMSLVPEIADALAATSPETALLAAGGIADGRGVAAALALGADGVVIGTRFWAAAVALTPAAMTDRAIAATGDATVRTTALDALRGMDWPRDVSFRFMQNRLTHDWADREAEAEAARGTMMMDYARARAAHDLDMVATVAGEAIGLIRDRPPAAEILRRLVSETEAALARLA
jgi:nitronate monooxygenase